MQHRIKPSEAKAGDVITCVLTTSPTISTVQTWPNSEIPDRTAVKITFADGGVLNTYDYFPITVIRPEETDSDE